MGFIGWLSFVLVVIGGLNWGLVAMSPSYDLVALVLGSGSALARIVYGLVGLSAVFMLISAFTAKDGSQQM